MASADFPAICKVAAISLPFIKHQHGPSMPKTQGRWRFRFSLKSLLFTMTMAAVVLAFVSEPLMEARRNRQHLNLAVTLGAKASSSGTIFREQTWRRTVLGLVGLPVHLHLYRLDFSGTKLTDDELQRLDGFQQIKELNLSNTRITDKSLASWEYRHSLRKLNLSGTQVTDQGILHLLEVPNLASLNVSGTQVSYAALKKLDTTLPFAHFCEEKAFDELQALGVQVVDARHFLELPDGTVEDGIKVTNVLVGMNRKISLTAIEVAHLNHLTSLTELNFHTVTLGPGGLTLLKRLPKLKQLNIHVTNLTEQDLESLSRQTQLEELTIGSTCTGLTDEGLSHLSKLKQLKKLSVRYFPGLTAKAKSQLASQLPNCQCEF